MLMLEFDGTSFCGWQVQPKQRTVQGDLEAALRTMMQDPELRVMGSGRTDSGVHALGMGVSFLCKKDDIPIRGLVLGLNSQLPDDIVVLSAREVPMEFCARRWAQGKRYRYTIYNAALRSPLYRERAMYVREPLDLDAMREGAMYMLGRHDFTVFRGAKCASKHAVRDVFDVNIFREGPMIHIEVRGSAFVRHMVRNMAGSLVEVGRGNHPPEWIQALIESRDRRKAASTAPAQGLYLVEVYYEFAPEPD